MFDHRDTRISGDHDEDVNNVTLDGTLHLEDIVVESHVNGFVAETDDECHSCSAHCTDNQEVGGYEAEIVPDSEDEDINGGLLYLLKHRDASLLTASSKKHDVCHDPVIPVHRDSKLCKPKTGILSPAEGQCLANSSQVNASHVYDIGPINDEVKSNDGCRIFQPERRMTSDCHEQDVNLQAVCSFKELNAEQKQRLSSRNQEVGALSTKLQAPTKLSEADSLDFVDWYLSAYCDDVSASAVHPVPMVCEKSPPSISNNKGPLNSSSLVSLANYQSRVKDDCSFGWTDAAEEHGARVPLNNRSSAGKDPEQISIKKSMNPKGMDCRQQINCSRLQVAMDQRLKLNEKKRDCSISSSSLPVPDVRRTGKNAVRPDIERHGLSSKELDMLPNDESPLLYFEASVEDRDADFYDVGIGTQIAAEAIEALYYAAPFSDPLPVQNVVSDGLANGNRKTSCSDVWSSQKSSHTNPPVGVSQKMLPTYSEKQRRNSSCSIQDSNSKDGFCKGQKKKPRIPKDPCMSSKRKCNLKASSNANSERDRLKPKGNTEGVGQSMNKRNSRRKAINPPRVVNFGRAQAKFLPVSQGASQFIPSQSVSLSQTSDGRYAEINHLSEDVDPRKKRKTADCIGDKLNVSKRSKSNSKFALETSAVGKKSSRGQGYNQQLEMDTIINLKNSNLFLYPRGKRTSRTRKASFVGVSKFTRPVKLVDMNRCNTDETRTRGSLERKLEANPFTCVIRRKKRTSVYQKVSVSFPKKNKPGNMRRQNEAEHGGLVDTVNRHGCVVKGVRLDVTSPEMPMDEQSRKQTDVDSFLSFCLGKHGISSDNLHNSARVASFNYGMGPSEAEAHPDNMNSSSHRQVCKKRKSTSLTRELVHLGYAESMPDFTPKHLRRRRTIANIQVLLSQNLEKAILKQQQKILARLGISMASRPSDATHFVADKFARTKNMLEIIALGKPVVTHLWLESCMEAGFYIDEKKYILRDLKKEKELGFSLPDSLRQAAQRPLLGGYKIYVTPNVRPSQEVIQGLVKVLQGQQVVDPICDSESEAQKTMDDVLVLTCEEDYADCIPVLQKGAKAYSSEFLLNGVITQKLDFQRHILFDHVVKNQQNVS